MTRPTTIFFLSIGFFLSCWFYRLSNLNNIIQHGVLPDFQNYYSSGQNLLSRNPNSDLVLKASFGPPTTLLPYLPLTVLPFRPSEYLLTTLNLLSYLLVSTLLYKQTFKNYDSYFFVLLSLASFSFPLIFSLASGNPMGIVTLGIYSFWIFKNNAFNWILYLNSVILKLFPVAILPTALVSQNPLRKKLLVPLVITLFTIILSVVLIPPSLWGDYLSLPGKTFLASIPDPAIYNQSFSSTLTRLGIYTPSFEGAYFLFAILLFLPLIVLLLKGKIKSKNSLENAILLLCLSLLLHPFPWQYYFAVLLPFVIIKIRKGGWIYLAVFLLLGLDGNKIPSSGILREVLESSQFVGTVLLYTKILKVKAEKST